MNELIRIQKWVVIGGFMLLFLKSIAFIYTASNAILSDALESIVNLVAGSFALYSLYYSSRPKDRSHPYGHGKIEFLSATLEGSLVLMAGLFIIGKAIYNFIFPQEVSNIDIGIYLTCFSGLANFGMGMILVKQGKKHNSMTLEADGKHLLSDAWTTLGLILGLLALYLTDIIWIDNAIALIFGAVIIFTGIHILKKSIAGIMDEADIELLKKIIAVLESERKSNWIDLHNLRVIKFGNRLHLDCHLTIPWYINIKQGHDIVTEVENLVKKHFGDQAEMFIHTDPCKESSCLICTVDLCEHRNQNLDKTLVWNIENTLGNKQHNAKMAND